MKCIETERIVLRKFRYDDLEDFYEYAKIEGVGEMAGWQHHENIEVSKGILENFILSDEILALELKENHKVIGSVGLHKVKEQDVILKSEKEIGYVLSKEYWGQGIMAEIVKAVINYAFIELNVEKIQVGHFIGNNQSKRVIEKCGFIFEKNSLYNAKFLGKTIEDAQYIMTKDRFLEVYK